MAKPDNRADNVEHLQEAVQNTIDNLEESEGYLDEHADEISGEEAERIQQKNKNRRESLKGMRNEIKDEADDQQ